MVMVNRTPPQSLDMEQAVLGAVVIDPGVLSEVRSIVRRDDFYRESHRLIYDAILDLYDRAGTLDLLALERRLRELGQIEAVGGPQALLALTDAVASTLNAGYYARVVRDKARRRRLIAACTKATSDAFLNTDWVDDTLVELQQSLYRLQDGTSTRDLQDAGGVMDEVYDNLERERRYTPTGYPKLDDLLGGLARQTLVVIAARPSVGKTAFAVNLAYNVARRGQSVLMLSLEMSAPEIGARLLGVDSGVDTRKIDGRQPLNDDEAKRVARSAGAIAEMPLMVSDRGNTTPQDVKTLTARAGARLGRHPTVVVVDYLQLLQPTQRRDTRHLELAEIARELKCIAKATDCTVVALSQVTRAVEHRNDRRPTLADLRDSGGIEAEADVVMFLSRPNTDPYADREHAPLVDELLCNVAKHRNGPCGSLRFGIHLASQRIRTLEDTL